MCVFYSVAMYGYICVAICEHDINTWIQSYVCVL